MLTTVLSNRANDPAELMNLAEVYPENVDAMRRALKQKMFECEAPCELLERFRLSET